MHFILHGRSKRWRYGVRESLAFPISSGYFLPLCKNGPFLFLENGSFFDRLKRPESHRSPGVCVHFQKLTTPMAFKSSFPPSRHNIAPPAVRAARRRFRPI